MDDVFRLFLENTHAEALEFAARSDVLQIRPEKSDPPYIYYCEFQASFLGRLPDGTVGIQPGPVRCLIRFPSDYLLSLEPRLYMRVASVLTPNFVHPNVFGGVVCLGDGFGPGTPISEVIWLLFQIVSYRNCTLDERNAMNAEACRLLRASPGLLGRLERPRLLRPRNPRSNLAEMQ